MKNAEEAESLVTTGIILGGVKREVSLWNGASRAGTWAQSAEIRSPQPESKSTYDPLAPEYISIIAFKVITGTSGNHSLGAFTVDRFCGRANEYVAEFLDVVLLSFLPNEIHDHENWNKESAWIIPLVLLLDSKAKKWWKRLKEGKEIRRKRLPLWWRHILLIKLVELMWSSQW